MWAINSISKKNTATVAFGHTGIGPYYWVGNCSNGIAYYAGQTFRAPAEGLIKSIKIFSSIVHGTIEATLSIFEFDDYRFLWKNQKAEITRRLNKFNENQWIQFDLPGLMAEKDSSWAFKISCHGNGMIAVAECPWNIVNPYPDGVEWVGSSNKLEGSFNSDFDLAFEGEIETLNDAKFI